ncbi:MAG: phosphoribosylformylglycinamidine synthase I [Candidatus ainarchaeum sp.]|nr:phosphoribosylformylglycinamidine synthase I [Candidatus ainarchaeum sp.]
MENVRAIVFTGFGVNCDYETARGFELAGAHADRVHIEDLISKKYSLDDYQVLALPGGFSYGDDIASGKVYANKLKYHLSGELEKFVSDGKLVIGICNGYQMLVKAGLLPGLDGDYGSQKATLTFNDSGRFESRWVKLKANPACKCVFTKGIDAIDLPVRHGEGKFIPISEEVRVRLHSENLIAFRYCDGAGNVAGEYPLNPNGSIDSIAGICDPTGRVFGMMPHPEAHLFRHNNPHWAREKCSDPGGEGAGLKVFRNAVEHAKERL